MYILIAFNLVIQKGSIKVITHPSCCEMKWTLSSCHCGISHRSSKTHNKSQQRQLGKHLYIFPDSLERFLK